MNQSKMQFVGFLFLAISFSFAVTWQMDSNQFRWSGTGKTNETVTSDSRPLLLYRFDVARAIVTFHTVSVKKNARLSVYSVNGVLVKKFDLSSGSNTIRWNITQDHVTAGIYIACLQQGSFENRIKISIIK